MLPSRERRDSHNKVMLDLLTVGETYLRGTFMQMGENHGVKTSYDTTIK
jgi:hypothetical protein